MSTTSMTGASAGTPKPRLDDIDLSGSDTEEEIPDHEHNIEETKEGEAVAVALAAVNPRKRKALTEEVLCDKLGLERMYQEFPTACKYKGRGCEQQYLKNLIGRYKEWSFQLFEGLAYTDLLNTVEALGSKPRVKQYMLSLRDRERIRYMEEVLHVKLPSYTDDVIHTSGSAQLQGGSNNGSSISNNSSINVSGYTTSSSTTGPHSQYSHSQSRAGQTSQEELDDLAMYHLLDSYVGGGNSSSNNGGDGLDSRDSSMAFSSSKTPSSVISLAAGSGMGLGHGQSRSLLEADTSIDRLVTVSTTDMTLADTQADTQLVLDSTQMETETQTQIQTQALDPAESHQLPATQVVESSVTSMQGEDDEAVFDL